MWEERRSERNENPTETRRMEWRARKAISKIMGPITSDEEDDRDEDGNEDEGSESEQTP